MKQVPIYLQISDALQQDIQAGRLKPADRLPSLRQMTEIWSCTPGTVQRAYQELVQHGLVTSRPGQGTHVVDRPPQHTLALRKAALLHKTEAFLLDTLAGGYSTEEIETALNMAFDRWRLMAVEPPTRREGTLRFAGSHDLALAWLASHFRQIAPQYSLSVGFCTSLAGLIALSDGSADFAGSHLWDPETNSYNAPYIKRILPGRRVALLTLVERRLGLIVSPGNPRRIHELGDLQQHGLQFANRQAGSGTRVWLDAALRRNNIAPETINGFHNEKSTHTEVAAAVAEGQADAGFGLMTAALTFGLDFIELVKEPYDLVIPEDSLVLPAMLRLSDWLAGSEARQAFNRLGGYDTNLTGKLTWIELGTDSIQ